MTALKTIRVVIADDYPRFRYGLATTIKAEPDMVVVGEAESGDQAVEVARSQRADIVLMDLHMRGMSGIEATRLLTRSRAERPVPVIVLTAQPNDHYILEAIDAGASGYLMKLIDGETVIETIRAVVGGRKVMTAAAIDLMMRELTRRRPTSEDAAIVARLTHAEKRAIAALSSGLTKTEQIASHLHISTNTVRSQLQAAMKKTGSRDRTELALWGVRNRLDVTVLSPKG